MMRLDELLGKTRAPWAEPAAITLAEAADDPPEVTSITQDSRTVSAGALFCALQGSAVDGHEHIDAAIDAGAVAVVVERHITDRVPELIVADSRVATGELAAAFVGHPSTFLDLVGVTGTNGKTSVVTLVAHIVTACGEPAASMGTLTGSLTTAAAPDFQQALRSHLQDGCAVVAAEISSHALDQRRVAGSEVSVAIFTNLSQDHLDYHPNMDDYFEAKARLFTPEFGADAIIDVSDSYGRQLADRVRSQREAGLFSSDHELIEVDGAAEIAKATLAQQSSTFAWRGHDVELPLGGSFSVTNAILAAEAALALGYDEAKIAAALNLAAPIPGRFESVDMGQPFAVIVDYSHTPASVSIAVESAREIGDGKVRLVFGAAGDRDPGKRPLMGAAATTADVLYVTSDNPRTEDPELIIDAVIAGVDSTLSGDTARSGDIDVHRIADRAAAIRSAITGADPDDIVVIAGKGHEDYQVIGTTTIDFDDRVHARAALAELGWESAS